MELSELVAYAGEKYHIQEEHKWADFPGFSVLCHPQTGKWVALLMRQWDSETGTEIERCDLKCGNDILFYDPRPFLASPIRMHGGKWISIAFDAQTEQDVVFRLFDQAVTANAPHGYTIVLGSQLPTGENTYHETELPFSGSGDQPPREKLPERLRTMRRLFEYGRETEEARAENFRRQAVFMQDYVDDLPWSGDFVRYFPTYRDLTTRQLRGYFTWRAGVRRGQFTPIATSAAYIYLYELLNGVGAETPEDVLQKLQAFETGYLESGIGDPQMRTNLRRWMLEYAVLNDLPPETAKQVADPDMTAEDDALGILKHPDDCDDEALFAALSAFGAKKPGDSPVLASDPERGRYLFCEAWRKAAAYHFEEKPLFTLCFGKRTVRRWYPLANAVYCGRPQPKERDYTLNACRSYRYRNGMWYVTAYDRHAFDKGRFQGFLHEADARLRRYLKTGRYLKENPANEWAIPYIDAAIDEDRKALLEASRPKFTIDLSGLERIRRDAAGTRDSLLTAEETEEAGAFAGALPDSFPEEQTEAPAEPDTTGLPLDAVQILILRTLLRGEDASPVLRAHHLMPSITADFMNEALYDEIGDTVLICENDRLSLVEDYVEDLKRMLGG